MGPSYTSPALPIDESIRSQSSREFIKDSEKWAHEDLGSFKPDRWLVPNEQGEIEFDSRAAPMQAFGAGVRACYGTYSVVSFVCLLFAIFIMASHQYCFSPCAQEESLRTSQCASYTRLLSGIWRSCLRRKLCSISKRLINSRINRKMCI